MGRERRTDSARPARFPRSSAQPALGVAPAGQVSGADDRCENKKGIREPTACAEVAKIPTATGRALERQLENTRAAMRRLVSASPLLSARAALPAGIPGIAELSAKPLPAEIPENLIGDGRILSAYAGVVPQIAPSGTSLHRSGLCRAGNPALRRRLTLAAVVAGTWCPEVMAF